jgi:hypothetical protein
MTVRTLLAIALASAAAVAACGDGADTLTDGTGGSASSRRPGSTAINSATGDADITSSGPVPTNSTAGKEFYKTNVHPFLSAACGTCHDQAGPGTYYLTNADPEKTYGQLFKVGYVVEQSRIVVKPAHGGVTTNTLNAQQIGIYNQWVSIELKDGGAKSQPSVLAALGACFDRTKFDAMKMGEWRTLRRTTENNLNAVTKWNENADTCTGCDNVPCTTCHSADPATNFSNAVGNTLLPADETFNNTKLTNPAYITKFFGTTADGQAAPSQGLIKKSDATKKDYAYTHPLFTFNATQLAAIDAFVNDAVTKFNAGQCGQTLPQ